jgi:hypothetical protein
MTKPIDHLMNAYGANEDGYPTNAFIDQIRAFEFSLVDAATLLFFLPRIATPPWSRAMSITRDETVLGPTAIIQFDASCSSIAGKLMDAILGHGSFKCFHTKWERPSRFTFQIPQGALNVRLSHTETFARTAQELPAKPQFSPLLDIVAFLLFSASRTGSWPAWRQFKPDERQRFLEWAEQEIAQLAKLGWFLTAERHEKSQRFSGR